MCLRVERDMTYGQIAALIRAGLGIGRLATDAAKSATDTLSTKEGRRAVAKGIAKGVAVTATVVATATGKGVIATGKAIKHRASRTGPLDIDPSVYHFTARHAEANGLKLYHYSTGFTLDKQNYFPTREALEEAYKTQWQSARVGWITCLVLVLIAVALVGLLALFQNR